MPDQSQHPNPAHPKPECGPPQYGTGIPQTSPPARIVLGTFYRELEIFSCIRNRLSRCIVKSVTMERFAQCGVQGKPFSCAIWATGLESSPNITDIGPTISQPHVDHSTPVGKRNPAHRRSRPDSGPVSPAGSVQLPIGTGALRNAPTPSARGIAPTSIAWGENPLFRIHQKETSSPRARRTVGTINFLPVTGRASVNIGQPSGPTRISLNASEGKLVPPTSQPRLRPRA